MNRLRSFVLLCVLIGSALTTAPRTAHAQDVAADLLGRINALRTRNGLSAYTLNAALTAAAQEQATWMVNNDMAIAHIHPNGSSPRSRAAAAGYSSGWVGENIYGGGMARVDDAWNFWINSSVHYAGLVNTNYTEIGIASASGASGRAYVLVFGNPGTAAPANNNAPANSANSAPAVQAPPSFVVGTDEFGNIQHEIQPGDTPGAIVLRYGYDWGDIERIMQLNGLTDPTDLVVGEIFLIPPFAGTHTPTPVPPTATPDERISAEQMAAFQATLTAAPPTAVLPTAQPPTPQTVALVSTAPAGNSIPVANVTAAFDTTPAATLIAITQAPDTSATSGGPAASGVSPWIVAAVGLQVLLLGGAAWELWSRRRGG
jgi:hypothetical protein